MFKLVWITDPHLSCASPTAIGRLWQRAVAMAPDAIVITGDIAEAGSLDGWLDTIEGVFDVPVYYVLGNHDFYGGSVGQVRARVTARTVSGARTRWLPVAGPVALTATTGLVGHDGWGDGRAGDLATTTVFLNDFLAIEDVRVGQRYFPGMPWDRQALAARLAALGDDAAATLRPQLYEALSRFEHVLVATHVPPAQSCAWHEGHTSDDQWAPFFVCEAVGALLVEAADAHPERHITTLCGHTHGSGEAWLRPNLHVRTAGAEYGSPTPCPPLLLA